MNAVGQSTTGGVYNHKSPVQESDDFLDQFGKATIQVYPDGFDKPFAAFKEICGFFKAIGYAKGDAIRLKIDCNSKNFVMLTMPSAKSVENNRFGESFRRNLSKCFELSKHGHDILIQFNKPRNFIPLVSGWKGNNPDSDGNKHIEWINHIVLESDTTTLDEQRALLPILKPLLTAAVYTGKKSIHYWVRVDQVSRYYWEQNSKSIMAHLFEYLCAAGVDCRIFDRSVLNTFSKFVRLPFMWRKVGEGRETVFREIELLYLNDNPCKISLKKNQNDIIQAR